MKKKGEKEIQKNNQCKHNNEETQQNKHKNFQYYFLKKREIEREQKMMRVLFYL